MSWLVESAPLQSAQFWIPCKSPDRSPSPSSWHTGSLATPIRHRIKYFPSYLILQILEKHTNHMFLKTIHWPKRSFFPGCPKKCKEADISFVLNYSQSFWTFHPFSQLYAVLQLYTVFLSDLGLSVFLFLDILITTLSLSFLSFRLCVSHLLSLAYRIFVISFTQVGSHSLY